MNSWTIIKLLSWAESYFNKHCIDSPRLTSELLLAHCLDINRLNLYLQYDRPLDKTELSGFKGLIKKRIQNQPVAYIIGEKGFFESDFLVTRDVLIPRPDTEIIVEQAIEILRKDSNHNHKRKILELGTGSGAIIISLAKEISYNSYFASDFSIAAIDIAKKNAERIANNKISFFCSNWFSAIKSTAQFDLILSNPPYVPSKDIAKLQPEIRKFEPMMALDGGDDGLDSYRTILQNAHSHLVPGGIILLEIGFDQKDGVINIVNKFAQYQSVEFIKDLAGHNRVVLIKK